MIYSKKVLLGQLKNGKAVITFLKKDNTVRHIRCTLDVDMIPFSQLPKGKKKESEKMLYVWDLDNNSWRSFYLESIFDFEKL